MKIKEAAFLAAAACVVQASVGQVVFTGTGDLPGATVSSFATAVSSDGQTVGGTSSGIVATVAGNHAFTWTRSGGIVGITMPLGWQAGGSVVGLSENGQVFAGNATAPNTATMAYIRTQSGVMLLPGVSGGVFSRSCALSSDGSTVLGEGGAPHPTLGFATAPLRWTAATGTISLGWLPMASSCTALASSKDGGIVCGVCFGGTGPGANYGQIFRWTEATGIVPVGDVPTGSVGWQVKAMSDDGSIFCGTAIGPNGLSSRLVRWTQGGGTELFDPPPGLTQALGLAISGDGAIIVGIAWVNTTNHAVIWSSGSGLVRLDQFLLTSYGFQPPAGWVLERATGISADKRVIVGSGKNPLNQPEGFVITLPWPVGCYANCDGSTAAPALNSLDFGCFLSKFAAGDAYANCDGSTGAPVLNALDFGCYLTKFAAGCM